MAPPGENESLPEMHGQDAPTAAQIVDACARLRPRIARLARALLRDDADADDATQMSLMEILRSAPTYRGEGSFDGWADRIAVRTTLRLARQRRVRALRVDETEPDSLTADARDGSMQEGLPRAVSEYLAELPETRRTVLVLRHALGYSIDEIAELTEVSPNTVKDRLLAARDLMRRQVKREQAIGARARGES